MVAHGMTCNCDDDGGIGGLLALEKTTGTNAGSYWYLYDGNGNVMQLLDASTLDVAAVYEYDAYGNTLVAEDWDFSGIVDDNPFRFSTKWLDTETGLAYYGYRYYSPRLGRWLSRDPIGEMGGINLYQFVRNSPLTRHDGLGLRDEDGCEAPPADYPIAQALFDAATKKFPLLGVVSGFVGAIPNPRSSHIYLDCTFEDASQRGFCLCKKRCRYRCDGEVKLAGAGERGSFEVVWAIFPKRTICTTATVWCKPSNEAHACEDGQLLGADVLLPASLEDIILRINGREWGPKDQR
jgi:RHS repeat-associated protein